MYFSLKSLHTSRTELITTNATECYYRSVLNLFSTETTPILNKCDFSDPRRANCTFSDICDEKDGQVEVTVRHCGSYYVYKLKAVRIIERSRFFEVLKNGLYSGTKNQTLPGPRGMTISGLDYLDYLFWINKGGNFLMAIIF